MKPAKPKRPAKPVKAWAIVDDGQICAGEIYPNKVSAKAELFWFKKLYPNSRVVRVEIREVEK